MTLPGCALRCLSLAGLIALAGCGTGSAPTPTTAPAATATVTPSARPSASPSARPSASPSARPSASPSPSPTAVPSPSTSAAAGLPVQDAAAFRDDLLALARSATFDPTAQASSNAAAIHRAWSAKYPALEFSLFPSQVASPTRVSVDLWFLIVRQGWGQALSFAVTDTQGRCAAGAAIIPGTETAVSEETVPTKFVTVDLPAGSDCSANTVNETYRPAS